MFRSLSSTSSHAEHVSSLQQSLAQYTSGLETESAQLTQRLAALRDEYAEVIRLQRELRRVR